jgi:hypothetical protein
MCLRVTDTVLVVRDNQVALGSLGALANWQWRPA